MAVYECNLGYMAVGEANRLCELDGLVGEWSGEEPTCESNGELGWGDRLGSVFTSYLIYNGTYRHHWTRLRCPE